jgi:hypothetical protein
MNLNYERLIIQTEFVSDDFRDNISDVDAECLFCAGL